MREAITTVGGIGVLPGAPGTFASLVPPLCAVGLAAVGVPLWIIGILLAVLAALAGAACLRLGGWAEAHWGSIDPSQVVVDEVAGQAVALIVLPLGRPPTVRPLRWTGVVAVVGFCLFRLLDTAKPGPIDNLQRYPDGRGILADDGFAGLCTAVGTVACVMTLAVGAVP